jgi:hypothetical protein
MIDPFESPHLLIEQAEEDYANFTAKRNAFFETRRTTPFTDFDPNTGEDVFKVRFNGQLPGSLRTTASNVLNNLRHALDQAVNGSVAVLGPKNPKQAYFPIWKDAADRHHVIKNKCTDVDLGIIQLLDSFKPYFGGDDLLWDLSRIAGPNKHQIVLGVDINVPNIVGSFHLIEGFGSVTGPKRLGDENVWELARSLRGSKVNANFGVTIFITFANGEVVKGQVVSALLDDHIRKVSSIVSGIEAETARILRARSP